MASLGRSLRCEPTPVVQIVSRIPLKKINLYKISGVLTILN